MQLSESGRGNASPASIKSTPVMMPVAFLQLDHLILEVFCVDRIGPRAGLADLGRVYTCVSAIRFMDLFNIL